MDKVLKYTYLNCANDDVPKQRFHKNLVDQYPEKLVDIHSYTKTEIIKFLAPVLDSEEDVDARCELLASLREKLCETLCEMFPEYGGLYNRRLLHTYYIRK